MSSETEVELESGCDCRQTADEPTFRAAGEWRAHCHPLIQHARADRPGAPALQYGAMLDVAEWFNDFVSVAEGGGSGGPAPAPHSRGRRRLSLSAAARSDGEASSVIHEPAAVSTKQWGRKRKAMVDSGVDSGRVGGETAAGAGATQQGAADCSDGPGGDRHMSAAGASQRSRTTKEADVAGRVGTVRWADDGSAADCTDARESEGIFSSARPLLQIPSVLPAPYLYVIANHCSSKSGIAKLA